MGICAGFLLILYATLFVNEPPLPPRLAEQRAAGKPWRPLFALFGPGAAPTLRFAAVLLVVTAFSTAVAASLSRYVFFPGFPEHADYDVAVFALAAGNSAVAVFLLALGAWLRIVLRSGIAARVLSLAGFVAACILPFLFALILDPDSFDRISGALPIPLHVSPVQPSMVGALVLDGDMSHAAALQVLIPTVFYGVLAFFFWTLVEVRVHKVRREDDARRAAREELMRTSQPPVPILQRASAPPAEPQQAPPSEPAERDSDEPADVRPVAAAPDAPTGEAP
jgi:hypothetical protein